MAKSRSPAPGRRAGERASGRSDGLTGDGLGGRPRPPLPAAALAVAVAVAVAAPAPPPDGTRSPARRRGGAAGRPRPGPRRWDLCLRVFLAELPETLALQLVRECQGLPLPGARRRRGAALAPPGVSGKEPQVWGHSGHHPHPLWCSPCHQPAGNTVPREHQRAPVLQSDLDADHRPAEQHFCQPHQPGGRRLVPCGPPAGAHRQDRNAGEAGGRRGVLQGFSTPCVYIFQPDMFVLRLVDMPVLEPNVPLHQTMAWPRRVLHAKIFVPAYSATLRFQLGRCTVNASSACTVRVTLGSATLPPSFQKVLNCTGSCSLLLASPPWEKWLPVTVESLPGSSPSPSVSLEMTASFTACRPGGSGSFLSFFRSLNRTQGSTANATGLTKASAHDASGQEGSCLQGQPVIREDLDVVSVRFRILGESNVTVQAERPTLLLLNLNAGTDSGGTLVLNLLLNETSADLGNATVWACLNPASPVLSPNATTGGCRTAFAEGYSLSVSRSSAEASLAVPYPESDNWFLSLHLRCPESSAGNCDQAKARLAVVAVLSPCFEDCGTYGQCSLMRRHGYLYAGCNCKAGWRGWSCTDGTKAQSLGTQTLATLTLTLSNLFFLPAIAVALYRYYLVEASVYTFTMFFSTFYHACDQPGVVVLCIMDYDTVQYCDFLGSVVSFWVTILCMARIKNILKYVLCVVGTLFIAMSLHLDRRGVWNMMAPCLVAIILMTAIWASRCVTRRHCYPPSWKRWAFFLFPGISLAVVAVVVYVFMETTENYYYTHSLWHILVAISLVFLLPPGDKQQQEPWAWSRKLFCRYQICKNDREELYAVT